MGIFFFPCFHPSRKIVNLLFFLHEIQILSIKVHKLIQYCGQYFQNSDDMIAAQLDFVLRDM